MDAEQIAELRRLVDDLLRRIAALERESGKHLLRTAT